jgi:hypothetical protein
MCDDVTCFLRLGEGPGSKSHAGASGSQNLGARQSQEREVMREEPGEELGVSKREEPEEGARREEPEGELGVSLIQEIRGAWMRFYPCSSI